MFVTMLQIWQRSLEICRVLYSPSHSWCSLVVGWQLVHDCGLRSRNLCMLQGQEVAAPRCAALILPKNDLCPALAEMIGDTIDDALDDDEMEEETDNVVSAVSHSIRLVA